MSGKSKLEASFRASRHVGVGSSLAGTPIRYRLQSHTLKNGNAASRKLYATVVPNRKVTQADLCRRLERENGKYSAAEYSMIIDQVAEVLADELHQGNCVNLPQLGHFANSLSGAFDPEKNADARQHAVRVSLRVARILQDRVNENACLLCVNGSQTSIKTDRVEFSISAGVGGEIYAGDAAEAQAVRPLASQIILHGIFRNLPADQTAVLRELHPDTNAALGEDVDLPLGPYQGGYRRRGEREELAAIDTRTIAQRLLPGTRWQITVSCATGEDCTLIFTVCNRPLRTPSDKTAPEATPTAAPAPTSNGAPRRQKPRTIRLKAPTPNAFPPPPAPLSPLPDE